MINTTILAVCGGSGSGKSTIVRYLLYTIGEDKASVLSMDHYYRDLSHLDPKQRNQINFDCPTSMDLEELHSHLIELKNGNPVDRPNYCFKTHTRLNETVSFQSKRYLLLDGILSIHDPNIYQLCDHSIYVDVDADLRFIRRLQRDMRERGRSVDSIAAQYLESVRSMFIQYVEPQKARANYIVDWNNYNYESVQAIIKTLNVPL